jgi:hypothetical protein
MGCVSGLQDKFELEKIHQAADEKIGAKVTALIVRNDQAITEYVSHKYRVTSKAWHRPSCSSYNTGVTDGRNVQINKEVDGRRRAAINNVKLLK